MLVSNLGSRATVLAVLSLLASSTSAQTPVPAAPVQAPAPSPSVVDQAAITAAYGQLNADYVRGDLKAFDSWFAPNYQVTGTDGKTMNMIQFEKATREQRSQVISMKSHWTLSPLVPVTPDPSSDGAQAISVTMTLHSEGTGQKKVMFFTAKGSFVDDTQMNDLWIQTPQGWRIERRKILSDHLQSHPD
jgi:hypothetical protein